MASFPLAHRFVESWEGGYSNRPEDKGGETFLGISRVHHPDWRGWRELHDGNIANAREYALELYRREYWDKLRGDEIPDQRLASILYQAAVNVGVRRAVRWLQECLLAHARGWLAVDGILGDKTLHKLSQCDPYVIGEEMLDKQEEHYMTLAARDPSQRLFLNGWRNRVMAARALV